jgi:hypothetical protein
LFTMTSSQVRSLGTAIAVRESRVRRRDSARLKVQIATVMNIDVDPAQKWRETESGKCYKIALLE